MVKSVWRVFHAFVKTVLVLFVAVTLLPAGMAGSALYLVLFTEVPVSIPEKRVVPSIQPSIVYDSLNNQIAVFKEFDSSIPAEKGDIPDSLKYALIAAEDRRFEKHNGVDARSIGRAFEADLRGDEVQQGASTITMQLVKQVYSGDQQADLRDESKSGAARAAEKLRQAIIANRLDRMMTKDDIIFEYLTAVYLGQGAYGIGAAAQTYFRKNVSQLTLSESATLVGIIPAPTRYEPRDHRDASESKRKLTLLRMLNEGYITKLDYDEALLQELWVDREDGSEPPVGKPVTVVHVRPKSDISHPYFVDYVRRYLIARYGEERVFRGGLQVETTIDPVLQAQAEEAAAWLLKGTNPKLATSIVSVEPGTGFVRAMVGGRGVDTQGGQVNLALGLCPDIEKIKKRLGRDPELAPACTVANDISGGGSGRSPGSSLKPVVLAEALSVNISPSSILNASTYCPVNGERCIRNYEGASYGPVSVRLATVKSVNTAYARLGVEVGLRNVAKMAQELGITSAWFDKKVHGASYSLGGIDVSPLEMAAVYSVFANRGLRLPATPIIRVTDAEGNVLEDNTARLGKRVLTEKVADNVNSILKDVVDGGTAVKAQISGRAVAGKTGTSQGNGNAWFVGYTPNLSTAVWVGYRDSPRPLRNIKGVRGGVTGGSLPAQTWHRYMVKALENQPVLEFSEPLPIRREAKVSRKELLRRKARGGIDAGNKRKIKAVETKSFLEGADRPSLPGEDDDYAFGLELQPAPPVSIDTSPSTIPGAPPSAVPVQPVPTPAPLPAPGPAPPPAEVPPVPPPDPAPAVPAPVDPNAIPAAPPV